MSVRVLGSNQKLKNLLGNVKIDYSKPVKRPAVCALPSISSNIVRLKPQPKMLGTDLLHAVQLKLPKQVPNNM